MPSVYAGEIIRVCDVGRLAAADIAAATGARETLVRAWLSGTTAPTGEPAERLMELSGLVERLARVITADYIPVWLHQPNRCLDDRPPAALIAGGSCREVSRLIAALEGMPVS